MTTVSVAAAAVKARIEANTPAGITFLRWQNEDGQRLPDTAAAFAYTEIITEKQVLAGFGGGPGANLWRNPAFIVSYVFVPRGAGLQAATDLAEAFAALFRGYRSGDLQCFEASVHPLGDGSTNKPPGLTMPVNDYYCAIAETRMTFDQVG